MWKRFYVNINFPFEEDNIAKGSGWNGRAGPSFQLVLVLILIILALFCSPAAAAVAVAPTNLLNRTTKLPALIAFGDSLTDPGNNNALVTAFKSNFPPYGRDFEGHRPTGRFSNGKLATDLLVEENVTKWQIFLCRLVFRMTDS
ncbi:hypothetical protein ACLOJK_025744 [Asimina triloba]